MILLCQSQNGCDSSASEISYRLPVAHTLRLFKYSGSIPSFRTNTRVLMSYCSLYLSNRLETGMVNPGSGFGNPGTICQASNVVIMCIRWYHDVDWEFVNFAMYTVFRKNWTPNKGWHNHKNRSVINDFSQNASTFNCWLMAFEKVDMDSMPPVRFQWQQLHHTVYEKPIHDVAELKQLLVKFWADFE